MENISPIYENVSIESWAQNIRQIKINELRQDVIIHEKIMMINANQYDDPERYKKIIQGEIDLLKEKIHILETK
jgi:hypothetical protein